MKLGLTVLKKKGGRLERLDCETFPFRKAWWGEPGLREYIDTFSRLVSEKSRDLRYVVSDTLSRLDGRTHFFDKLSKCAQLIEAIESAKGNFRIENLEPALYAGLRDILDRKGIRWSGGRARFLLLRAARAARLPFRFGLAFFLDLALLFLAKAILPKPTERDYDCAFLSFYDYRCKKDGRFRDDYFQPLIERAARQGGRVVVLLTLYLNLSPWKPVRYMRGHITALRDIAGMSGEDGFGLSVCNRLLSTGGLVRAYIKAAGSFLKAGEKITHQGLDVSALVNASLEEDYFRCEHIYAWKQFYFFERLLSDFSIKRIVYAYENHPWEKFLALQRNRISPATRLVGFQHTSFSMKLLQYFPGKFELDLPFYPDKILTVGKVPEEVMNEFGEYGKGLVEPGCALRHEYIWKGRFGWGRGRHVFRKKVAYAFSFDMSVYPAILDALRDSFEGSEYTVYLKVHPIVPVEAVIKGKLPYNFIMAKYMPWEDIFREIDILFYDDNSLGIEALKHPVDVAYFGLACSTYDCDRLFKYGKEKISVNSKEELKTFISDYYRSGIKPEKDLWYRAGYLSRYFAPITPERLDRFLHC
ncbi:MAG: hypothetical protein K8I01_10475 [Candidatus Methylomirabilis sp.]|nr:hypothetical protein [Deltaproteobacteria bacterium]